MRSRDRTIGSGNRHAGSHPCSRQPGAAASAGTVAPTPQVFLQLPPPTAPSFPIDSVRPETSASCGPVATLSGSLSRSCAGLKNRTTRVLSTAASHRHRRSCQDRFRSPLSACSASLSSCLRSASKLALAAESFVAAALIAHLRANCRRYSGRALMQHATSAGLSSETRTALPFPLWRRESGLLGSQSAHRNN
jgi:hypothetical protein